MYNRFLSNSWFIRLVTLCLLGLLAYQAARLFWQVATPATAVSVPTLSPRKLPVATLPAVRLTADTAVADTSSSATSNHRSRATANLTLTGTYLAGDSTFAIIQTPQGSRVLGRGDALADNVVVTHIDSDHVVLDNDGEVVQLSLADNTLSAVRDSTLDYTASVVRPALLPTTSALPHAEPSAKSNQTTLHTASAAALWQRLQQLGWEMQTVDGQIGYKMVANTADQAALLTRFGLQSNDVVLAINEQPLTPQTLKSLSFSKKISAKIKRNATIQTIDIKLNP